jgi:hypothetical protein
VTPPAPAPRVAVALDAIRPARARGSWRATWRIRNDGAAAITIVQAWHPHGRFRSRRRSLALRVRPGSHATLDLPVRSDVAPDEVVENAFLILQVTAARRAWRVFARFRLFGQAGGGVPGIVVEAVDAHPVEG